MVAVSDRQKSDEGNLHASQSPQRIPCGIANVDASAVSTHAQKDKNVQGDQVRNEDIPTPCRHHVAVE